MEHCPNCGTPARPGAKFCTTCGFRFSGDQDDNGAVDATDTLTAANDDDQPSTVIAESTAGWPSPPVTQEPSPTAWDQSAGSSMTAPAATVDEPFEIETVSDSWPHETVDAWPARPDPDAAGPVAIDHPLNDVESESADESGGSTAGSAENAEMVTQAMRLLDELRDTIAGIGSNAAVDLSGVVAELEVAVSPPGAMAPDQVTELREALLAARERPRDLDTIVDLTQRIDAMLGLVIAYDRTIAAIERSLETLRG